MLKDGYTLGISGVCNCNTMAVFVGWNVVLGVSFGSSYLKAIIHNNG